MEDLSETRKDRDERLMHEVARYEWLSIGKVVELERTIEEKRLAYDEK
jgi:hypothetical protein